jgi:CheY-like chemotaxis protein
MSRILVIDDDDLVRVTMKRMLEAGGHEVALAVDGIDGIRRFRAQSFDLVICDIFMPNKEGVETLRELQRVAQAIPIVTMSGGSPVPLGNGAPSGVDYLRMSAMLGATRTLSKPFSSRDLLAVVQECLKNGRAGSRDSSSAA